MRKVLATISFFAFASAVLNAQWVDHGAWTSASLSQKIMRKTVASADLAARFDRDFTRIGSTFINTEIDREVANGLNLSLAFRGGASMTNEHQWEPQRRIATNARYKKGLGDKASISIRLQYQSGHKGVRTPGEGLDFSKAARTKATLYYKVAKGYRLSFSGESFFRPLYDIYEFSDVRGRISMRKKLSKRKYLTIGYQLETPRGGPDPWVEHAIICNFSVQMKRRKSEK